MNKKEELQIKEGDYFSYCWKDEVRPRTDPYWCRDGRCVAILDKSGEIVLVDTFNYWPFHQGELREDIFHADGLVREFSRHVDLDRFNLSFICNLKEYELLPRHEDQDHYDGVVDVSYQCTKRKAIKVGSTKSVSKMVENFEGKIEDCKYKINSLQYDIEYYENCIKELLESNSELQE